MLYLFNTTIMPNEGVFMNRKISTKLAWMLLSADFTSAIGHQGSADAFNACFPGLGCKVNRIPATMEPGDEAIALKVLGRLPEGQILDLAALEAVGYEFYHIQCLDVDSEIFPAHT